MLAAAVSGLLAIRFLLRYVRTRNYAPFVLLPLRLRGPRPGRAVSPLTRTWVRFGVIPVLTADEMRRADRHAIEAGRASRGGAHGERGRGRGPASSPSATRGRAASWCCAAAG